MPDHTYRIRNEPLGDDTLVVVRGGLLEATTIRTDALAAAERFGVPGISVFAAPDHDALDDLAREKLIRFEVLTIITVGALRSAGLEIIPTFRRPHLTILLPDLDGDLKRLLACDNAIWHNDHHQPS